MLTHPRSPFLVSPPKPLRPLDMDWSELIVGQTVRVDVRDTGNLRWRHSITGTVLSCDADVVHVRAESGRSQVFLQSLSPRLRLVESAPYPDEEYAS